MQHWVHKDPRRVTWGPVSQQAATVSKSKDHGFQVVVSNGFQVSGSRFPSRGFQVSSAVSKSGFPSRRVGFQVAILPHPQGGGASPHGWGPSAVYPMGTSTVHPTSHRGGGGSITTPTPPPWGGGGGGGPLDPVTYIYICMYISLSINLSNIVDSD